MSLVDGFLDMNTRFRLARISKSIRLHSDNQHVYVVSVDTWQHCGSSFGDYSSPEVHPTVGQHTQTFSSLGGALDAIGNFRQFMSRMFCTEAYTHPMDKQSALAEMWKPKTNGSVTTWTTWTFGSEPEAGQGSGTRLEIQLSRNKINGSARDLIASVMTSADYEHAVQWHMELYSSDDDENGGLPENWDYKAARATFFDPDYNGPQF